MGDHYRFANGRGEDRVEALRRLHKAGVTISSYDRRYAGFGGHIERLIHLRDLMDVVPLEKLNMDTWCGSVVCALGHAVRDPWFNEQGFICYAGDDSDAPRYRSKPSFQEAEGERCLSGFEAARAFFEIGEADSKTLFGAYSYTDVPRDGLRKEVCDRITNQIQRSAQFEAITTS